MFGLGIGRLGAIARAINSAFSPSSLFSGGAPGVWYDPSDYSTLFQNSTGTTPVTAVEQPVGLMLDKSQGLVLGPELVTNGDFSNGTTGWAGNNATPSVSGGALVATPISSNGTVYQAISTTIGRSYVITVTLVTNGGVPILSWGVNAVFAGGGQLNLSSYSNGSAVRFQFTAQGSVTYVGFGTNPVYGTSSYDNISVKELPGNHAFQSTSASRPVLSARYNLLTKTEQFNDAAWTKSGVTATANTATAPDGTVTADTITVNTLTTARHVRQFSTLSATTYTFSYVLKYTGSQRYLSLTLFDTVYKGCVFDIQNGAVTFSQSATGSVIDLGSGWYRCTIVATVSAGTVYYDLNPSNSSTAIAPVYTGNGTDNCYIWGASLVPSNQSTLPYQRVNTSTDYDTTGFLPYLKFDGVDDSLSTNSISFTSTDKMSVFAGVRKLSDAALGILVELSAIANSNPGTFAMGAPGWSPVANQYGFMISGGTGNQWANSPANYPAPNSAVLTNQLNLSTSTRTSQMIERINGAPIALSFDTGGTTAGNFGNYPLYIGRRNNASYPFNGQLYSMTIVGKQVTATELSSTETYTAIKTGVTLA